MSKMKVEQLNLFNADAGQKPEPAGVQVQQVEAQVGNGVNVQGVIDLAKMVSPVIDQLGLSVVARDLERARPLVWAIAAGDNVMQETSKVADILRRGNARAVDFADKFEALLHGVELKSAPVDAPAKAETPPLVNEEKDLKSQSAVQSPVPVEVEPAVAAAESTATAVTPVPTGKKLKPQAATRAQSNTSQPGTGIPADSIVFQALECSRWNRSFKMEPDAQYVCALAEDIKQHKLMHPVVLVRSPDGTLKVLTGWNRVLALKEIRGPDGSLQPDEYRVVDNLSEKDEACFSFSVAENKLRRESSPYQQAAYIARIVENEGISQQQVAEVLTLDQGTVSRLISLAEHYSDLPESWRQDLKLGTFQTTRISRGHWDKVAGAVKKHGLTPQLKTMLVKAYDNNWSVRELDAALGELRVRKPEKTRVSAPEIQAAAPQPAKSPELPIPAGEVDIVGVNVEAVGSTAVGSAQHSADVASKGTVVSDRDIKTTARAGVAAPPVDQTPEELWNTSMEELREIAEQLRPHFSKWVGALDAAISVMGSYRDEKCSAQVA